MSVTDRQTRKCVAIRRIA